MKVEDLILELKKLDPEIQVVVVYDVGKVTVNGIELVKGERVSVAKSLREASS